MSAQSEHVCVCVLFVHVCKVPEFHTSNCKAEEHAPKGGEQGTHHRGAHQRNERRLEFLRVAGDGHAVHHHACPSEQRIRRTMGLTWRSILTSSPSHTPDTYEPRPALTPHEYTQARPAPQVSLRSHTQSRSHTQYYAATPNPTQRHPGHSLPLQRWRYTCKVRQ